MLQQAYDFCHESDDIYNLLSDLSEKEFLSVTQFKNWTGGERGRGTPPTQHFENSEKH